MPLAAVGLSNQDLGVSSPNPHIEVAIKTNEEMMYTGTFQVSISLDPIPKKCQSHHGIHSEMNSWLVSLIKFFSLCVHFFSFSPTPSYCCSAVAVQSHCPTILIGDALQEHNILTRETLSCSRIRFSLNVKSFLRKSFSCMTTSLQDCISTANCQLTAARQKTRKKGLITEVAEVQQ